ncbi:YbjQ family protein [Roseivivax sp. CAU 1753]
MSVCIDCGNAIGNKGSFNGRCSTCHAQHLVKDIDRSRFDRVETASERQERYAQEAKEKERNERALVDRILITTESQPDINIQERITVITAECAYGMNIFKDLFAGVRNVVGGRSEAVQKTMRDARETVLYELKREAHRVGANAVVGIDLDYVELAATGSSMLMLVASGTAVRIE